MTPWNFKPVLLNSIATMVTQDAGSVLTGTMKIGLAPSVLTLGRSSSSLSPDYWGPALSGLSDIAGRSLLCLTAVMRFVDEIKGSEGGNPFGEDPMANAISQEVSQSKSPGEVNSELGGTSFGGAVLLALTGLGVHLSPSNLKAASRLTRASKGAAGSIQLLCRGAFQQLESPLDSLLVSPAYLPEAVMIATSGTNSGPSAALSLFSLVRGERQASWVSAARQIGTGPPRPELYVSSSLSPAKLFGYETIVNERSRLDPDFGVPYVHNTGRARTLLHSVIKAAVVNSQNALPCIAHTSKEDGPQLRALEHLHISGWSFPRADLGPVGDAEHESYRRRLAEAQLPKALKQPQG